VLYTLSQRVSCSHRLTSAIRRLDYDVALNIVASDLEKKGMRILGGGHDQSEPHSLVVEGPRGKVAVKVVAMRAPEQLSVNIEDKQNLKCFARANSLSSDMAVVGLMPGAERSSDGHQGFFAKYQGLIEL
jgi:hypothetical protein